MSLQSADTLKISASELNAVKISGLENKPNYSGVAGRGGLTPAQLKAKFDEGTALVAAKLNAIITALALTGNTSLAARINTGIDTSGSGDYMSLADLFTGITDGTLAKYIKVNSGNNIPTLKDFYTAYAVLAVLVGTGTLTTTAQTLVGAVNELKAGKTAQDSTVSGITTRIGTAEDELDDAEEDIDDLQASITTLQGLITSLQNSLTSLGNLMPSGGGTVDASVALHNVSGTAHSDIRTLITAIQNQQAGENNNYVCATVAAAINMMNDSGWSGSFDRDDLKTGDYVLIVEEDTPDFWVEISTGTTGFETILSNSVTVNLYAQRSDGKYVLLHKTGSGYTPEKVNTAIDTKISSFQNNTLPSLFNSAVKAKYYTVTLGNTSDGYTTVTVNNSQVYRKTFTISWLTGNEAMLPNASDDEVWLEGDMQISVNGTTVQVDLAALPTDSVTLTLYVFPTVSGQ